ncbi:MAG: alpha-ketoglutarate-dependent dioxygenase AlkB, partial [Bacteroidota bacterium]
DDRMKSRRTASFGEAYNYSQIKYPFRAFPDELLKVLLLVKEHLGFEPNNCLINYYPDGKSTMGWHSDQMDILEGDSGVAIISLGAARDLRFREINNKENRISYNLPSGSLIYMNSAVQEKWHHSIPKSPTDQSRMSLTFRRLIS